LMALYFKDHSKVHLLCSHGYANFKIQSMQFCALPNIKRISPLSYAFYNKLWDLVPILLLYDANVYVEQFVQPGVVHEFGIPSASEQFICDFFTQKNALQIKEELVSIGMSNDPANIVLAYLGLHENRVKKNIRNDAIDESFPAKAFAEALHHFNHTSIVSLCEKGFVNIAIRCNELSVQWVKEASPLSMALTLGYWETIPILLNYGAELYAASNVKKTPSTTDTFALQICYANFGQTIWTLLKHIFQHNLLCDIVYQYFQPPINLTS